MIRQYFRQHIRTLIMLFFVIGAFFVSFYLYQMPMEPAIYGLMLSLFFILVLGIWDYFRFKAKHQELQMLKKQLFSMPAICLNRPHFLRGIIRRCCAY